MIQKLLLLLFIFTKVVFANEHSIIESKLYYGPYMAREYELTPKSLVESFSKDITEWVPVWSEERPTHATPSNIPLMRTYKTPYSLLVRQLDIKLSQILAECLAVDCVTGIDKENIQKIYDYKNTIENQIIHFSYNDNEYVFYHGVSRDFNDAAQSFIQNGIPFYKNMFQSEDSSSHRHAISTLGPGAIFFNIDTLPEISYLKILSLLTHEYGHQIGLRDDETRYLDHLGNKIADFEKNKIQQLKTDNFSIISHNKFYANHNGKVIITKKASSLEHFPSLYIIGQQQIINMSAELLGFVKFSDEFDVKSVWIRSLIVEEKESKLVINLILEQLNQYKADQSLKKVNGQVRFELKTTPFKQTKKLLGIISLVPNSQLKSTYKNEVFRARDLKKYRIDFSFIAQENEPDQDHPFHVYLFGTHLKDLDLSKNFRLILEEESEDVSVFNPTLELDHISVKYDIDPDHGEFILVQFPLKIPKKVASRKYNIIHLKAFDKVSNSIVTISPKLKQPVGIKGNIPKLKVNHWSRWKQRFTRGINGYDMNFEFVPDQNTCNNLESYFNLFRVADPEIYIYRLKINIQKPQGKIDLDNIFFAFEYQNKNILDERHYGPRISNFYYKLYNSKTMPYKYQVLTDPRNSKNLDIIIDLYPKYFDHFETGVNSNMWFKVMAIYFQTSSFEGSEIYLNDYPNIYSRYPENYKNLCK